MSPFFRYHTRDVKGKSVDGMVEALNEDDATKKLQKQGLFMVSIDVMKQLDSQSCRDKLESETKRMGVLGFLNTMSSIKNLLKRDNFEEFKIEMLSLVIDGEITDEKLRIFEKHKKELRLSDKEFLGLKVRVYKAVFDQALKDSVIDELNEKALELLQKKLEIPNSEIVENKNSLAKFHLLRDINNGNLPMILNFSIPNVVLKSDERVYWVEKGTFFDGKRNISGKLLFTNKRVFFTGNIKSFAIDLGKILDFKFYIDAVTFSEVNKTKMRLITFDKKDNMDIIRAIFIYSINHRS